MPVARPAAARPPIINNTWRAAGAAADECVYGPSEVAPASLPPGEGEGDLRLRLEVEVDWRSPERSEDGPTQHI